MALDIGNNCYVSGQFSGTVDFNPGAGTFLLSSSLIEGKNVVLKLDANGVFIWAKSFLSSPTATFARAYNIAIEKFDIYILQMIPAAPAINNYYLTRIDSGGNLIWQMYMFQDLANPHIMIDTAHNVYISGDFWHMNASGLFSLDPIYGRNFITKANSSGAFIWVKQFGCMSSTAVASCWSTVSDIMMNQFNEIFTTGFYSDSSDFNPDGNIINSLYATTSKTMFIQKLSNCENLTSSISDTACKNYNWNGLIYSANGNYTQTFINNRGCDSSVTLHLFLNGINAEAAIIFDTLLQALTGGTSGISFQWLDCDSGFAIIPGATNSSFSPNTNGHYAVVFQFNGCIDTSDNCYTISVLQTNDILFEDIYVGPNPTSDKIFIRFKRFSMNPYTIELYNMLGERILVTSQHEIDVSKLPKGIYYLKLMNFIKKIAIN